MRTSAVRRLQFSAGHRVFNHENKCANLHGHNYVVYLHARADALDAVGRVIDFGVLKEKFGTWIDMWWDHGFLMYEKDPVSNIFDSELLNTHKLFLCTFNPTAENMAAHLLNTIAPILLAGTGVELYKVVLWETENCCAEVELGV